MRSFYRDWCLLAACWALMNLVLFIGFAIVFGRNGWPAYPAFAVGAIAGAVCAFNLFRTWKREGRKP